MESPSHENTQITQYSDQVNHYIRGIEWYSTGHEYGLINDKYLNTLTSPDSTWQMSNYYFGLNFGTGGATEGSSHISWVRAREPPPNNVMPGTSLQNLHRVFPPEGVLALVSVVLHNSQENATWNPFNQEGAGAVRTLQSMKVETSPMLSGSPLTVWLIPRGYRAVFPLNSLIQYTG